jgi:hypothetical protein
MKAVAAVLVAALLALLGWLARPSSTDTTLHAANLTVTVSDPHPGMTDVALVLTGPGETGAFIQVQAVMPVMGYATPEVAATAAGDGRYIVSGVTLVTAGPWELRVRIAGRDALTWPFQVTGSGSP